MTVFLTAERLRELFDYDPLTGIFMRRIADPRWRKSRAGYIQANGYRYIGIGQDKYQASQLAVLYMTGRWPTSLVDHRDLDTTNDRWANLREADYSKNSANRRANHNKTMTKLKGAYWDKSRNAWLSHIEVNGHQIFLGRFATDKAAHARYVRAARHYFGEFARP